MHYINPSETICERRYGQPVTTGNPERKLRAELFGSTNDRSWVKDYIYIRLSYPTLYLDSLFSRRPEYLARRVNTTGYGPASFWCITAMMASAVYVGIRSPRNGRSAREPCKHSTWTDPPVRRAGTSYAMCSTCLHPRSRSAVKPSGYTLGFFFAWFPSRALRWGSLT